MLAREKSGMAMLVQYIVVAVLRNILLENTKAVGMYGANEHRSQAITEPVAHPFCDAVSDALLQFLCGPLSEREGDDRGRFCSFRYKGGHSARDGFCLARTRTGNYL